MKNVDKNKGTIGDNNGAEEIDTRKSSDAEGFVKDNEIVSSDAEEIDLRRMRLLMWIVAHILMLSMTVCGFRMSGAEMRYHLRRMWGRFGLKDVIVNNKGRCFSKFLNEEGMNKVIEQGHWLLFNITLEAWCVEGISAIASSIGKPIIMNSMTANMCKQGFGRIDYARVLVEIDASKGFKDVIKLMYKDKQNNCKGVKKVKVEYSWKPLVCDFCKVFGHVGNGCTNKPKVINVDTAEKESVNEKMSGSEKDRFTNVNYKRKNQPKQTSSSNKNQFEVLSNHDLADENQESRMLKDKMKVDSFLNKKLQPSLREVNDWSKDMVNYFKQQWEIDRQKEIEDQINGMRDVVEDVLEDNSMTGQFMTANVVEAIWNIRSMNQEKKQKEVRNVIKDEKLQVSVIIETHVKAANMSDVCSNVFGRWEWVSNSIVSSNGCKIVVGWNTSLIKLMDIQLSRQNHCPAVLSIPEKIKKMNSPFRFMNYVVDKPEFLPIIQQQWSTHVDGFGVFQVANLKEKLKIAQTKVDANPHDSIIKVEEAKILLEYKEAIIDENKILSQKAKIDWLREGDKNSAYIHEVIKGGRLANKIISVCDKNGNLVEGELVAAQFVRHFQDFLSQSQAVEPIIDIDDLFSTKLTKEDNDLMIKEVTDAEIKEALFDIRDNKSPGPDGYSMVFLKKAWSIVGQEVCLAIKEFFNSGKLLTQLNSTAMVSNVYNRNERNQQLPATFVNVSFDPSVMKVVFHECDQLMSISSSSRLLALSSENVE
nr:hypothetical protein [Tanacetum cinerariifolium]